MSNIRDFVISRKDVKTKAVEFGGQTLYVKQLKAREVRDVIAWQAEGDKGIHPQVWWLIAGICNEDGSKVFQWSDAEHLNEVPATDVNLLYEAINEVNATANTPSEIAKNS